MSSYRRAVRISLGSSNSPSPEAKPQREITDAAVSEIFFRHSQCVFAQKGAKHPCPMLLFSKQIAEELNSYFNDED